MIARLKKLIEAGLFSVALVLVLSFGSAWAQDDWDGWNSNFEEPADEVLWLRDITSISISVSDAVTGGCWTNANAVKNAMELGLRRAGIEVAGDGDAWTTGLHLTVSGVALGDNSNLYGCVGSWKLVLRDVRGASHLVTGASGFVWFAPLSTGGYMKQDLLNESARTSVIESTDALALRILRAWDTE
jgi:hypothetical protein